LLSGDGVTVHLATLLRAIRNAGLWKNDPRLVKFMTDAQQLMSRPENLGADVALDKSMFRECIKDNIVLIRRALTGDLVIPEFSKFCAVINDIYYACRTHSDGRVTKLTLLNLLLEQWCPMILWSV
jgi:glutaminase